MANISGRMESHHPAELGVVKRVRMKGVRVTFFLFTATIEAISTMKIPGGVMTETEVKAVTVFPPMVTIMVPMTILDTRISMVLMAFMAALRWKNVTLHSYPLYHAQLCWTMTFHPPSSLLLCGTCNM